MLGYSELEARSQRHNVYKGLEECLCDTASGACGQALSEISFRCQSSQLLHVERNLDISFFITIVL